MQAQDRIFQLSEPDEQVVRAYECTRLRPWFVPPIIGTLTVTNKRIVYHSAGKSLTGRSLLINEMPLEDVSALSVYEGFSLNLLMFLLFSAATYFVTLFIHAALPRFFTSIGLAIALMVPFAVVWLFGSKILNEQVRDQAFDALDRLLQGRAKVSRDMGVYLPYCRIPFYVGLAILAFRVATAAGLLVGWIPLLAAYWLIFVNLAGRRHTFSLAIGSRTTKEAGILIPGDTFRLLLSRDATALQTLGAGPGADAGKLSRELGALVLDMQQLGDMGIRKWQEGPAPN